MIALFGAIAVVGTLGVSTQMFMRGPMQTMSQVNQETMTDSSLMAASKMLMIDAEQNLGTPDCDSDRLNEPRPWRNGAGPTGGGLLPNEIGTVKRDPWGTEIGYCVWDHGSLVDDAACGGAGQNRLQGGNVLNQPVIAVISAGKDLNFDTTCSDWADVDTNDIPDTDLIVNAGDDIIVTYSYAEAAQENPDLWSIDIALDANSNPYVTAVMDPSMDAHFSGSSAAFGGDCDGISAGKQQCSIRMDGNAGLLIPDQTVLTSCDASTEGQLRRNTTTTPSSLEICESSAWTTATTGGASGNYSSSSTNASQNASAATGDFKEVRKIFANDSAFDDEFAGDLTFDGHDRVAIDGRNVVVGAAYDDDNGANKGAAYVFDALTGKQKAKFLGPAAHFYAGYSVDIHGDYAIAGSYAGNACAHIFEVETGNLIHTLTPADLTDVQICGQRVFIGENYALVGASGSDPGGITNAGFAYIFDVTTGAELFRLEASDQAANQALGGGGLAIYENFALVAATGHSVNQGAVYVFDLGTGLEVARIDRPASVTGGYFGISIEVDGDNMIIGHQGAASVHDATSITTLPVTQNLVIPAKGAAEDAGESVGISGNYAIVSARASDDYGTDSGTAYIFDIRDGTLLYELRASDAANNDMFGAAVDIDGNIAVIGSPGTNGTVTDSGAFYTFVDAEHYIVQANIRQTGAADNTIGGMGFVAIRESDTAGHTASIGFNLRQNPRITDPPTAAIMAVREGDPGYAELGLKTFNGETLQDAMAITALGHLGLDRPFGDSINQYSYLQMGDHSGIGGWDTNYQRGLLLTDSSAAEIGYLGFKGDADASASLLYSDVLRLYQGDIDARAMTEYLRFDSSLKTTIFGSYLQTADGSMVTFQHRSYASNASDSPDLIFTRYRGKESDLQAVTNGNQIGEITFNAYDGNETTTSGQAAIWGEVNGTVATGDVPTDIVIGIDAAGDALSNEVMRIASDGQVGIGKSAPNAELDSGGRILSDQGVRVGSEDDDACAIAGDNNTLRYTGSTVSGPYESCLNGAWRSLALEKETCSPIPFDFKNVSQIANSTEYQTETIRMGGYSDPCPLTVASDSDDVVIVLNDVDQAGTIVSVSPGDTISLKIESGASEGSVVRTYISLGDKTDEIKVTTLPVGYFVAYSTSLDGNMGGMKGADELCFQDLDANNWLGKSSAGTLTRERVQAFLCDSESCNSLAPNTKYFFAVSGFVGSGGDSFTTTSTGVGPGDADIWSAATKFNAFTAFWTGRGLDSATQWGITSLESGCCTFADTCGDWTSNSGGLNGTIGMSAATDQNRWNLSDPACNENASHRIICIVQPE